MIIAQLANFHRPGSGGLRITVDRLRTGYLGAGHQSVLVVPGAETSDRNTDNGRIITLRAPVLPGSGGYRVITDLRRLNDVLDDVRPDRIEVSDKTTLVHASSWAGKHMVPTVLFSHERIDAMLGPRVPRWFPLAAAADQWNRRLAARFDVVVAASQFAAEEYLRIGVTNVVCVPLGVDLELFRPRPTRAAASGRWRLVYVGRLSPEKRPELAVDATRRLRTWGIDAGLTVLGSGPMEEELRVRADGMPVAFLGHVDERATVAGELSRADVAVAPCPGEAFGLAALEALACGTPVVAVKPSGPTELLTPETGVSAWGSPDSIATAIVRVMGMPRQQREEAARRRATAFPWEHTVARMLTVHGLPSSSLR